VNPGDLIVTIDPVRDFAGLAADWLDLERRADGSFFQSWAWTGCLADERFPDPWLLCGRRGDQVVALGVFNRRAGRLGLGRTLLLGESGDAGRDSVFIEHNGLLLDRREPLSSAASCWRALGRHGAAGLAGARWVVSGAAPSVCDDMPADRRIRVVGRRPAFRLDLTALPAGDGGVLERLSANARQQLRRSLRLWDKIGPLAVERADNPEQAADFLEGLKSFHQRYWTARGRDGAFAQPFFGRFHRALLSRPAEGQSVDLLRIAAGSRTIGFLYNFIHNGWVAAYQSGFDYGPDSDQLRPGRICHLLSIGRYRRAGMRVYDFLAGEARYKRSFAGAESELLWIEVRRRRLWSFPRAPVTARSSLP
jgi:CelD/BcsL family acetyltransferase involved in cellulose biosynthesis